MGAKDANERPVAPLEGKLSPLIFEASTFVRRANSGRAEPPMVVACLPDGRPLEVYLKSPWFHEAKSPFVAEREWMAAKLAEALSLPSPQACKVRVSKQFIDTIPDEKLRNQLLNGPDVLFASQSAGSGWNVWTEAATLPRSTLPQMVQTYLFDTVIQNWDRCIPNPNMLLKGDEFLLIDHEEAFVTATGTPAEQDLNLPPWLPGAVDNHVGEFDEHPFWRKLKPKSLVNFEDAFDVWKKFPDDIYQLHAGDIPDCWNRSATDKIASYLENASSELHQIANNVKHNFEE